MAFDDFTWNTASFDVFESRASPIVEGIDDRADAVDGVMFDAPAGKVRVTAFLRDRSTLAPSNGWELFHGYTPAGAGDEFGSAPVSFVLQLGCSIRVNETIVQGTRGRAACNPA